MGFAIGLFYLDPGAGSVRLARKDSDLSESARATQLARPDGALPGGVCVSIKS